MSKPLWSQAGHTLTVIEQQEPELHHIKTLHDGALTDLMQAIKLGTLPSRDLVRQFYKLQPAVRTIIVNYDHGLRKMIKDCGCSCECPDDFESLCSLDYSGSKKFEVKLLECNLSLELKDAITLIQANGWIPGKIEHLLSWGKVNKMWKHVTVVSPGTIVDDNSLTIELGPESDRGELTLCNAHDGQYVEGVQFLMVRECE